MSSKKSLIISAVIGALILGPVSVAFYQALGALPYSVRMFSTGLAITIFILAFFLILQPFREMGAVKYWLLGATLLLGLGLYASSDIEVQSADVAQAHYSDGTQIEDVKPSSVSAWGRAVSGYNMHPAYGTAVVLNSLVATFASHPGKVNLLFAKPPYALFQRDGTPTASDGVSVELSAFDAKGNLGYSQTFMISQESFLKDKWIEKAVRMDAGIASMKVTLGWGPPGSTPNFDATIVGFQVWNWHTYAGLIGKVMLVCIGFFVVGLFLVLNLNFPTKGFVGSRQTAFSRTLFFYVLVLACVVLLAYWSESKTSYVFYWDFRNYWEKTESLYELFIAGSWAQAIGMFSSTYATDYSMLPSVLPALLSLVTGYPTRINYSLIITVLYAVPAYIMVAYLAKRLIDGKPLTGNTPLRSGWVLASFPVFFGLPTYFGTTLYLMPDIGGVIPFVGALLSASTLVDAIRVEEDKTQRWKISTTLLRASISLGVLFSLMFVFRRWYVFAAVGIACSLFVLVLIEIIRTQSRGRIAFRAISAAVLMAFAALPLLCWVLFVWSRDFGRHDYSTLYAAYQYSLGYDVELFGVTFGFIAPLLCVAGGALLYRQSKARSLLFLLTVSTCIACVLFLHVQSPGRHHFLLLMPLLGACLAGLILLLARRFGPIAPICLTLLLVIGSTVTTLSIKTRFDTTAFALDWKPQHQKYSGGFIELSQWLESSENKNKKFCLIASSPAINQGVFGQLWQLVPSIPKHSYDQRLIQLGQVDSVNGPPMPTIRQCEIFLVGVPFQTHMPLGRQSTLEIVQKDMLNGTGIGAAVAPTPKVFSMGDGIEMRAYQTVRDITDEEYADLVKRFLDGKGAGYINPAANL
ncbi:hypothetical protein PMI22_04843 [Pseudomonas sp. GM21]|uniref:hypothetical protein n=1 Tax=Pseudomonas sp. GM21 TaxID=1144325 RepID=UPI00027253F5|nr:hypothetical protein [Pseudomonas sp. GM21]EJM13793.1 hypothetical protein PMI22_04843 [Pseudomonas sp. GM21]